MKQDNFHIGKPLPHQKDRATISFYRDGSLETQISYGRLEEDVLAFAKFLTFKGAKKGDRVVLLLEKSLIWVVAHLAVLRIGAICVPLNTGFTVSELYYLIHDAEPSVILADDNLKVDATKIFNACSCIRIQTRQPFQVLDFYKTKESQKPFDGPISNSDDPALMIYTSGTTGRPKGALLTLGNLNHDAGNIIDVWKITKKDVLCHALPLFHIHGLCFALHTFLLAGGSIAMLDRFKAKTVIQRLLPKSNEGRATVFMAVPTMYALLTAQLEKEEKVKKGVPDFSHLRLITSGSAPLLEKEFKKIAKTFGKEPVEREGMSETGINFSNPLEGKGPRKPGSIGLPMPGVKVRIVDPETKTDVLPQQTGEFWLKSPSIIKQYWNKPEQTRESFENGWFKTGDLGWTDQDGYYYLTDRLKHLIITGGENVSAKEVETVINQIPGVKESCVVGIPHEKWGEQVAALVVQEGSFLNEKNIIEACKKKLHAYKCPKTILFSDHLPKNTMGKILKEQVKPLFLIK